MTKFPLFVLLLALSACVDTPRSPGEQTKAPNGAAQPLDGPSTFSADPSAKMTVSEWNALLHEVKSLPGARVDDTGPMLTSINVGAPNEPAFYIFTQPAHPAHPAYLKIFPSSTSSAETTLVAGYAGSRSEFETFVRAFLEHMRASQ